MEKIYNKDQAKAFFLRNHEDSVLCRNGDKIRECECYPEAVDFFAEC